MRWTECLGVDVDAGARARGEAYERQGRVQITKATPTAAEAVVSGTRRYRVSVARADREIGATCTCPYFEDADCKHVWATLLALDRLAGVPLGPEPIARRVAPPPPPPAWESRLEALVAIEATDRRSRAGEAAPWPAGRQVLYEVDVPATAADGRLTIGVHSRQPRRDGTWQQKPLRVTRKLIDSLPEQDDREALSLLLGARRADQYYYFDDPYETSAPASFRLEAPLWARVLPLLCVTGRCVTKAGPQAAPEPLSWDGGEPWRLALVVRAEGEGVVVEGVLRRGGEERRLETPSLLTATGLVLMEGRASFFDHGGAFSWVCDLRQKRRLEVPAAGIPKLREALLASARRPPLELSATLGLEEVCAAPRPRLRVTASRAHGRKLLAELSFQYGATTVAAEAPGWAAADSSSPRLHVRDDAAERAALQLLHALGAKRPAYTNGPLLLSPTRLAAAVAALTREGWLVEADGRLYRRPSRTSLRVSSGIDWFDVEGTVDFDGQRVALPRLLQALRRGEKAVVLDDGSVGMLPEEWLRRQAGLARFGEAEGESFRFQRAQASLLDALLAAQPDAETDAAFEKARAALGRFEGVRALSPARGFAGRLRGYQELGLGWMAFLRDFGFGGCLADDMGLGKTVQVLALLASRRGRGRKPSLVVVPRSLVFNWKAEAARFAPRLRVREHTGLERARDASALEGCDVLLTTYGTLRRDAPLLQGLAFDYVVLDEAQAIKNRGTESAKAARLLRAEHRLALSGTPVENHLGELQSLFDFLNPGLLGKVPLARGDDDLDEEGRAALARGIAPFILRRTKAQVARDLPPKTEQTLWCDLEPEQRSLCDELRDHYRGALLDRVEREGLARSRMHVLEALLRMRQAACHPGLVDPQRAEGPSAKLDALVPRLAEVVAEGHKALVFSQFTSFLALLAPRLDAAGLVHEYLDGRTRDRAARVERFQTDEACGIFLISLKAGGLGLNLTAAEYVFLLDPWWNPAVEAQAVDRTHRIGQARPVFAYRLVARGTVEEKVLALQEKKRALADAIVRADEGVLRGLRREDLELLLA